jgi:hypothetical protein
MAEWSNAPDSKSGIRLYRIEGSNPSCSAKYPIFGVFFCLFPRGMATPHLFRFLCTKLGRCWVSKCPSLHPLGMATGFCLLIQDFGATHLGGATSESPPYHPSRMGITLAAHSSVESLNRRSAAQWPAGWMTARLMPPAWTNGCLVVRGISAHGDNSSFSVCHQVISPFPLLKNWYDCKN